MRCPNCQKGVPEDALFCPYCGFKLQFRLVKMSDLNKLRKIATILNTRFLPAEWKCIVDEKKKRLLFAPSAKAIFLAGFKRSRAAVVSTLILALDTALKRAEEELDIKLQLVEMSKISYFTYIPYLYYEVLIKSKLAKNKNEQNSARIFT
ncbi:MAG: hypothetical protein B6U76_03295 [Desulfurococcales archaeon ex4484_217_2]|nr:MAG: hypothetical protein B6U76_03295 [Desulfurococcales archaeon ex4484_217_2]